MSIAASFDLPPRDALAYFRAKGLRASFAWQDVWKEEHVAAFTVAKMANVDLLADVRDAVDAAIANGETFETFAKKLTPVLQRAGWWGEQLQTDPLTGRERMVQLGSARRLETIFRTNVQTAYAAGEYAQVQENKASAPYLMYDAVDDNRTRPEHRAWDNTVLPIDDAFWQSHWPPNGWRCRCSVIQLGQRDLDRMGREVDAAPPEKLREYVNKRSGEVSQVPEGIDPGWDYNPGAARQQHLDATLAEKRKAFDEGD